jgi:hypothetical protein
MTGERHGGLEPAFANPSCQRVVKRTAANDVESRLGKLLQHVGGGVNQNVMPLLGPQVGDGDDAARNGRDARQRRRPNIYAVVNDGNLACRYALESEPLRRRTTVCDDLVGARVCRPLQPELDSPPARIHFPPAGNADRDARESRGRQPEDVRREIGRVDNGNPMVAAPCRKGPRLTEDIWTFEAGNRKRDAGYVLRQPIEQATGGAHRHHVHRPLRPVKAADELQHLMLRAARLEARKYDGNRQPGAHEAHVAVAMSVGGTA